MIKATVNVDVTTVPIYLDRTAPIFLEDVRATAEADISCCKYKHQIVEDLDVLASIHRTPP